MARRIAAVLAHDDSVSAELVASHIPDNSGIDLVTVVPNLMLTAEDIRGADSDLLLVACREHSDEALSLAEWWHSVRPGRPVLVLSRGTDHAFMQRVFAAGGDDVVALDAGPYVPEQTRHEVEFAIRKAVARSVVGGERAPDAGTLVAVLGPKGGTGKTVVSTNLAVALAQRGRRVALVDLDFQFGDVALAVGLNPEVTIFDLAVSGGSIDAEKLDDFLLRHPSGLRVLAAPTRPDHAASVATELVLDVYDLLRHEYDFVIVDSPPSFDPSVIATIDVATSLCLVGMLDALSLKNARLGLETLDLMSYPTENVKILLNRAGSVIGLTQADVVAVLGRAPDVLIPSDRAVPRSLGDGVPVVIARPKTEVAKAFETLADMFTIPATETDVSASESTPERRSLFGGRRKRLSPSGVAGTEQ